MSDRIQQSETSSSSSSSSSFIPQYINNQFLSKLNKSNNPRHHFCSVPTLSPISMNLEVSTQVSQERSLRSIPPVYAPSFFLPHGKEMQNQTFCILADASYHVRSVPELRGMRCEGSGYGWLILQSYYTDECYLFNPVTLNKIQLPALLLDTFEYGVLTYPPTDPKCVVMLFSEVENCCNFCRVGDEKWSEMDMAAQNSDIIVELYKSVVSCNGKVYLFFFDGMAVIDVGDNLDACMELYNIKEPRGRHTGSSWRSVVEANGQIFLVCKTYLRDTRVVRNFVIYRLDLSKMDWVEVDTLGDKIFLLAHSSRSVAISAAELGVKGNCLYFFADGITDLCRFDMVDGTIAITRLCPTKFSIGGGPFWLVPDCKLQVQKPVTDATKELLVNNSNLPPELLETIFQSLRLGGCIRFRLASKAFMSFTGPVRSFPLRTLPVCRNIPCLISLPLPDTKTEIFHCYHPIYNDVYAVNIPQLEGAITQNAKFGWLLMSRGLNCLFFFHPLTMETVKIPPHSAFECISFSSPPTSSDCVVFGLRSPDNSSVDISVYHKIQDHWSRYLLKNRPYTFAPSHCNPVFHNGVFYCLSRDGKIGVFNQNETNEEDMWTVYTDLSVPDVKVALPPDIPKVSTRGYIMECDGEIFSIFVGFVGNPVRVYKLDQSKKKRKWLKVRSLGDRVMFLSHTTSLLIPAVLKGTGDRVYLPRFKRNCSVFYSLKSGKYHSLGDPDSRTDWIDTSEHCNCTWFQTAIDEKQAQ